MPQIGGVHNLYFSYSIVAGPPAVATLNTIDTLVDTANAPFNPGAGAVTINNALISANFHLHDIIRDVNVGGSQTTVDTTVREDVKQGFSTQLIAFSEGSMTLQTRYEPTDAAGLFVDETFLALMTAFTRKQPIFGVDLDKPVGQIGAMGLAGNWSVGFGNPKPVGGLAVVDWNLVLSSKGQYVVSDAANHSFRALTEPQ